jgi:nucleotide-binding universal stress UspA family protein
VEALSERLSAETVQEIEGMWRVFEDGSLEENLYEIPHEALIVIGAFGHGLIRDLVFGSMMERVQSTLPNNLLVVGPNYVAPA